MLGSEDVTFYAEGSSVALPPDSAGDVTLANGVTYYAEVGASRDSVHSVHWRWASALVASITYERTNFPDAVLSAVAGANWKDSGVTALSIPGGSAGNDVADFADNGMSRMRAKVVVTTGAKLRGRPHSKAHP